jgi:hypothetical protein
VSDDFFDFAGIEDEFGGSDDIAAALSDAEPEGSSIVEFVDSDAFLDALGDDSAGDDPTGDDPTDTDVDILPPEESMISHAEPEAEEEKPQQKPKPKTMLTEAIEGPRDGLWELQVIKKKLHRIEVSLSAEETAHVATDALLTAIQAGKVVLEFRSGHVKITAAGKVSRTRLLYDSQETATKIRDAALKK